MMFPVRAALISALPAFLSRRTANFSALQRRLPPLLGPAGRAALSTLPSSSPAPTATAAAAADSSSQKPAVAPPQAQITTTASSVTPETVRGRHVFKVSGYSLLKGLGVGKFVRSSTFAVGGYDWCVRYCPESDGCSDSGCIAVFLALMTKDVEVRALFDFRLVNPATGGLSRSIRMERPAMFNDAAGSLGYQMFQKRTVLEASEYLRGDCLVIQCDVTVIVGTPVPQSEAIQAVVPSDSDIQALPCEDGQMADYVMITVKGEEFRVHRSVLAVRSPVFIELELDVDHDRTRIDHMEPDVFKALLHFVYTDSLPAMDDLEGDQNRRRVVKGLLEAADKYCLDRLKLMCASILCKELSVDNVAATLDLAIWHHCRQLKDNCIGFITSSGRMDDVVATEGYKRLKVACPNVVEEIRKKAAEPSKNR
ncbi:BTB/POZ and MATH domain-containing protein 1 [Setaria viridis]|uniref:BTB domain-containing protein n=1 Tax=Setaria viridis TaxID=4556 RepID=A0A4U6TZ07_SETVI|nr:BTB/POZ and MATH domain-containing protein 1-like [Setaria viridis]TKW08251.1 hypothetical protein SEVIR_6G017000v2 [Setaria viridis]